MARTRSQRRAAAREARAKSALTLGRFWEAPAAMRENPNRAKYGAARLDVTGEREARRIRESERDYRPLTVVTPLPDSLGRKSRARSSYVI